MNTKKIKSITPGICSLASVANRQLVILSINSFKKSYPNPNFIVFLPANFENVELSKKRISKINLDPVVLSCICGTIFGDSSLKIDKNYKNARLQMRHSTRQTEWFMWKSLYILSEFIENVGTTYTSICFQKPDGFQRKSQKITGAIGGEILGKWKVLTKADSRLTSLHSIICKQNKKTFKRSWLNHMNAYFLMVLWLDDGSLIGARQGVLSLNSTPLDQAEILKNYICTVWKVNCEAKIVKSKQTKSNPEPVIITISDLDNLEKWLRIIAPIIPVKSMLYKVCIYYKDSSRLQRWTSELKTLVRPEWHEYLDTYYAYLGCINDKTEEDIVHEEIKP